MKTNKKSASSLFNVLYLIVLLTLVLLYFGFVYPKLDEKASTLDSEIQLVSAKIDMISPYEMQLEEYQSRAEQIKNDFDTNDDLHDPVLFSNLIYSAADGAGVVVTSLTISENTPVAITNGIAARSFTAAITVTMKNGQPSNRFIETLEKNEGCAMYVSSITYGKTGTEDDSMSLTVELLTVEKQ